MEINQLRYFLKVYELLNYSKAADELLISRQALRQSIQSLEKELGTALFINSKNHLFPTSISNTLYEKASKVVSSYNQMECEIRNHQPNHNKLRLGLCSSLFPFFTPELEAFIEQFEIEYPHILMDIEVCDMDLLFERLDNNECDAIITLYQPNPNDSYRISTIRSYQLGVTVSSLHPKAKCRKISLKDLDGYKATCMGNIEKTMYPLYKKLKDENINLTFEKVENPIDAFYLMEKNEYCMFNSKWSGTKNFNKNNVDCKIEDFNYVWDLDVISLYPIYEFQVLADYLMGQYRNKHEII
ncbi:MAG: LysR family transcriptional regulator [Erysipelotrichales bacterium]|nr:LysR family transcriptional regulator [Erysipelotrichales bacterium]